MRAYVRAHAGNPNPNDNVWDENTKKGKEAVFAVLLEMLGEDYDITTLDAKTARTIRDSIRLVPINRNKNPLVRNLSLVEAMKVAGAKKISSVTAAGYYNTVLCELLLLRN